MSTRRDREEEQNPSQNNNVVDQETKQQIPAQVPAIPPNTANHRNTPEQDNHCLQFIGAHVSMIKADFRKLYVERFKSKCFENGKLNPRLVPSMDNWDMDGYDPSDDEMEVFKEVMCEGSAHRSCMSASELTHADWKRLGVELVKLCHKSGQL